MQDTDENEKNVKLLPTIKHFRDSYSRSSDSDDKKGVRSFKMFESREKFLRLRQELVWIKENKVPDQVCDQVIGRARASRFTSYVHWAELMLQWMSTAKA